MDNIGLYIHIPFCASKCPYCDFYSFRADEEKKQSYVDALLREIGAQKQQFACKANSLYIGGGTPSVLSEIQLSQIIEKAKQEFLTNDAEITVECNPHGLKKEFFKALSAVGVNRISLGLQSANDGERKKLGRRADREEIANVIADIKAAGIENISLDVMLGIPDSTQESLKDTLDFCISQNVTHISCYILKLEEGTYFYENSDKLNLPDEDSVCDMYLFMCDYLEKYGFLQYEISNFAKSGYESRHNLKYWNCEEYLGIGAAAHSFIDGKRFCYNRNADKFINGAKPVFDGEGGDFSEYAMLRLRLCEGVKEKDVKARYGTAIPEEMRKKAQKFAAEGYLVSDSDGIQTNFTRPEPCRSQSQSLPLYSFLYCPWVEV